MEQILFTVMDYISVILCLKVLTKDHRKWLIDLIYLAPIFILGSAVLWLTSIAMIGNAILITALTIFLCLRKNYTLPKAIILSILSHLIATISVDSFAFLAIFFIPETTDSMIVWIGYHVLISFIAPLLISSFFVRTTKEVRQAVNDNPDYQTMLVNLLILLSVSFQIIISIVDLQYTTPNDLYIWMILFGVGSIFILIGTFVLYVRSLENKHHTQRRNKEQRAMLQYMRRIEKQYTDMRKFKHDYRNILSSLDTFIVEDNMAGLKAYFNDKIKPVSEKAMEEDLALGFLSKIRVREIKSILTIKLMMAQDKGLTIELHVREEITHIQTDTLALVRMLGIILDNAIEELIEVAKTISEGRLAVEVWKDEDGTNFIIQNTCRPGTPKLHRLQKEGFSTKGKGRGLGLNNLATLMTSQPNVFLNTSITENTFTQKIVIGD